MARPDYTYELSKLNANLATLISYLDIKFEVDSYTELLKCGIISPRQYAEIMQKFNLYFTPELGES